MLNNECIINIDLYHLLIEVIYATYKEAVITLLFTYFSCFFIANNQPNKEYIHCVPAKEGHNCIETINGKATQAVYVIGLKSLI
ncbi:hypothetical protein QE177_10100 [Arsenophonus sp. aPb]|uniref:hypothetical protein n=1 Tax=Arsenophonus sp. aPb TaxID=3041619 RepID=UPI0024695B03|nr:hypothetical protein [Arsenophonus sp. aPb]WGL97555.1 hypothetical protein QE177_10100 [Arsenophonus sp. aPb]